MLQKWYSNAKLILTGEYLVLFGAKALAIPLKYGQSLEVIAEKGDPALFFTTEVYGIPWFEAKFNTSDFEIIEASDSSNACYIQELLIVARLINPSFLRQTGKIHATARVNFNMAWGVGGSSSLISNIAWWANVDPFELNRIISRGSGYDIACARHDSALYYSLNTEMPVIEPVVFNPVFKDHLWFVYLGKKMATEANLSEIIDKVRPEPSAITEISAISEAFVHAKSVSQLSELMTRHELIISNLLGRATVQSLYFYDFKGVIKSLGAWGGDFCMVVTMENEEYVKKYFEQKGLTDVLSLDEISIK